MSAHVLWFVTRGAGIVSLLLLTAVVVLGVAGATRWRNARWPRFVVAGLHRNLTLLALALIAIHVITTVTDGYAPISFVSAVLPFTSPYRPLWLGLGAIAFDLLLALTVTSLLRMRIGYRTWRALHWFAYASWPIALVHALGTGSDARMSWLQLVAAVCVAAVAAAVLWRVAGDRARPSLRFAGAASVIAVPLAIGVFYLWGPDQSGWAARAGTPASLLPRPATRVRQTVSTPVATLPKGRFTSRFTGRVHESGQDASGRVLVDISGTTSGTAKGRLWIRLQGEPVDGGGVSMTASGATYGPPGFPDAYIGKIVALNGPQILLSLSGHSGDLSLLVDLRIGESGIATGTVHGHVRGL
ncbi:MAG TPA: ferric reductase-like transmembrane domain-containing protein [Gaiellaceae bacterium]